MKCKVFYESWQMECCGIPFKISDTVKWLVYKTGENEIRTSVDIGAVDYCYEGHRPHPELCFLEGKVETIEILYERFEPLKDNSLMNISVEGKLIEAEHADGSETEMEDLVPTGYVVRISS